MIILLECIKELMRMERLTTGYINKIINRINHIALYDSEFCIMVDNCLNYDLLINLTVNKNY